MVISSAIVVAPVGSPVIAAWFTEFPLPRLAQCLASGAVDHSGIVQAAHGTEATHFAADAFRFVGPRLLCRGSLVLVLCRAWLNPSGCTVAVGISCNVSASDTHSGALAHSLHLPQRQPSLPTDKSVACSRLTQISAVPSHRVTVALALVL